MKNLLYYLIQVVVCSGILYGYYHFFLRNRKFHIYNRFYLLIAATISILIPFLNFPVYFSASETNSSFVLKTIASIPSNDFAEPSSLAVGPIKIHPLSAGNLVCCCYILITIAMIVRIALSLEKIRQIKKKYPVQKLNSIYFINTNEPGTPFSFFRWLFWNQKIELKSEKGEQVFRHELFHIDQRHSLDMLYMELLTTIFWINPFLHLARKEIKVIHEFLADQFAMDQTKKWEYAELLLMQSLNTEHHLTNPFFYNQIKRRITMITSSPKTSYQYLRKLMALPVAVIVIALFAFSYKSKKENISSTAIDKPVTVVIDAGHGIDATGKHTGVTAWDDTHEDDIVLSIAKKIKDLNTNDRLKIVLTRENENTVDLKKRVEFSNSQNADLLISLHTNAASKQEKDAKGMDILYSGKNPKYFAENKILATILYNYFYQIHPVNDIKLSKDKVYIIDNSSCPSALVECGYLTDPNDLALVEAETGQAQIAKSILQSIEQYFLQKEMPDWEERQRIVADTATPVITFNPNPTTGKMEGSYNGKKFNKMTEYEGQFAFYFDDEASTMIMISKEQTDALKTKYGKVLKELIIKGERNNDSIKEEGLQKAEKEFLIKQEAKQLQLEKSQKEYLLTQEEKQKHLEEAQKEYLIKEQSKRAQLEKSKGEFLIKQKEEQKQLERSKKEYLLKQQKEQVQLEKSKKEFLIKQREEQKQLERSEKKSLLKQQKERVQLEKSNTKDSLSTQN